LGKELERDGTEEATRKLLGYERTRNMKALDNTTFRTRCTFVGYASEDNKEYDQLVGEGHCHIVFTDCKNIKGSKQVKETQQFFQVQGAKNYAMMTMVHMTSTLFHSLVHVTTALLTLIK
jgi:hypothetical protein